MIEPIRRPSHHLIPGHPVPDGPSDTEWARMLGRYDGEHGLPRADEERFEGFGGRRAWREYVRAYEGAAS